MPGSGRVVADPEVPYFGGDFWIAGDPTGTPEDRIGIHNSGSTNNVERAFPARILEEMHQNVAHPRELVTESCLFKLSICGLE